MNIGASPAAAPPPPRAHMMDDQYSLFRDLDRRCVAGSLNEGDCRETVRLKRASIESELNRDNPVVREVLAGKTTFVAIYDSYSRSFRGLRRFIPHRHNPAWNERLDCLAKVIPNVKHFTRRSVFAADNPVTCSIYGFIAAFAIAMVWFYSTRGDNDGTGEEELHNPLFFLAMAFGIAGFLAGSASMVKYRTRDPHRIHAREAAAYMDLNYAFHRAGNDRAWSAFISQQGAGHGTPVARPHAAGSDALDAGAI